MIRNKSIQKIIFICSVLNILLTISVIFLTYILPNTFAGVNKYLVITGNGQDFVTLFVVMPIMIIALILSIKGSLKAEIFLIGAHIYIFYSYLFISLVGYNQLFLAYITIASISFYTVIVYLINCDYNSYEKYYNFNKLFFKAVGVINIFIGTALALLWYSHNVIAIIKNDLPMNLKLSGYAVVYIMDLTFLVPFFIISGILLLMKKPIGYVLSGIILVKALTIGLMVISMSYFLYKENLPLISGLLFIVILFFLSIIALVFYMINMNNSLKND